MARQIGTLTAVICALVVATASIGSQGPGRKKLLFLTHAGLYKHTSLGPAEKAVIELGRRAGST